MRPPPSPRKWLRENSAQRRSTKSCSPVTWTSLPFPTSTFSSGPPASSAFRTFCSGSPHMPSWSFSTRSGRISTGGICGMPASSMPAVTAGMAAPCRTRSQIDEKLFARYLDEPAIPDVDLFVRSSGEQRLSNFLLWQSAYAELVFLDTLWPDFDRRHLWHACELYASRDRRYGGAVPNPVPGS